MKKTSIFIIYFLLLPVIWGQNALISELNKLKTDPGLSSAAWGFYAYNLTSNKVEAEHNKELNLVPASVMKTITTASALEILGPEFRFKTRFYINGTVSDEGILNGDLIIRGGGDPTFGSETNSGRCPDCLVNEIIDMLKAHGIKLIAGDILADDSYFEAMMTPGGWNFSDIGNRYGASPSGLSFMDNTIWFLFNSGREGSKAEYVGVRPNLPGFQVYSEVIASGIGDNAYVFGAEYSNHRFINGKITPNQKEFEVKASMPDPPFAAAYTFYNKLNQAGIYITGVAINTTQARIPINYNSPQIKLIGTISSPTLFEIAKITNKTSNNLYAEHLHKAISAQQTGQGQNKLSNDIIANYWKNRGLNSNQLFITDGSGLSRSNAISVYNIVQLFKYMHQSKYSNHFYESLSIAGVDGTLKSLCTGTRAANNVHAKSGTMSRVKAYAGYVDTRSGQRIAFAIVANNYNVSTSAITKKMENLMVKMAEMP